MFTKSGFEKLFKENYPRLFRIVRAYFNNDISDEIVCETFVKIWDNQNRIQIKSSWEDYLTKAVTNTCIDYYRKEQTRKNY